MSKADLREFHGLLWVILSLLSTILMFIGFYTPYWIVGKMILNDKSYSVYFGSFRRCNYPFFNSVKSFYNNNLKISR